MKKILLLSLFIFSFAVQAQRTCGTGQKMEALLNNNPDRQIHHKEVMDFIQNPNNLRANRNGNGTTVVVTIPVVFHILYKNATQNISDAQILSQLTILNNDYRKLNADFATVVPPVFQPFGADMEINFVMAVRTPNDMPTTGIERKSVASSFNFSNSYYTASGLTAWDPTSYLNIWIGKFSGADANTLGFAYLPDNAGAPNDGLCIGYEYVGNIGTASAPYNKGRTATHEIGHYFGLLHPWGNDGAACGTFYNSDGIADTPATNNPYYFCPSFPNNTNACSFNANGSMFMNYMDYVDDGCMAFFTAGQKTVMQNTLAGPRVSLLSSMGGIALGTEDFDAIRAISIYPNPATSSFTVNSPIVLVDRIEVYNNLGQIVKMQALTQNQSNIDVQELTTGIYYIKMYNSGNLLKTDRLVKK